MKILFFTYGIVGGGAERVTSIIANGLAERGHNVGIVINDVPLAYHISNKVKIYNYFPGKKRRLKYRIGLFTGMRRILREERPDYAVGVLRMYCRYLLLSSIGLGIKSIAWDHSPFKPVKGSGQSYHLTKYLLYPFFTHTFVLTEQDYHDAWFKSNVTVMPNPVPFDPSNKPATGNVVLGVGNLGTWRIKGFDLLMRAWAIICKKYPDWHLRIIGRGNPQYLNSLADSLSISDSVQIETHSDKIIEEYRKASIFVLSSRSEGFPMVLIESMSQGCASISFSIGGRIESITNSKTSLLIPDGDWSKLADGLSELIENHEIRDEMGRNAIELSKSFSLDMVLDRWEKILTKK